MKYKDLKVGRMYDLCLPDSDIMIAGCIPINDPRRNRDHGRTQCFVKFSHTPEDHPYALFNKYVKARLHISAYNYGNCTGVYVVDSSMLIFFSFGPDFLSIIEFKPVSKRNKVYKSLMHEVKKRGLKCYNKSLGIISCKSCGCYSQE